MTQRLLQYAILVLLLAAGHAARAEDTNAAAPGDFQSFRVIQQRNIFNPNRRRDTRGDRAAPAPQPDWFTLKGIMSYEDQSIAFFDGSNSSYRKAAKIGDNIAGYKVAEITNTGVKLAASSNQTLNLHLQSQMRRQPGGPWSLIARADPSSEANPSAVSDDPPASTSGGAADDARTRLMKKREQEMKDSK
jgi:hypothetical protein